MVQPIFEVKSNKSAFHDLKIRAEPYYNLCYAIKGQAIKDLMNGKQEAGLLEFCERFFVEDKNKNDIIIEKALRRRVLKMLKQFIKELENLEIEVIKMKMSLDKMYQDMLKDDKFTAGSVKEETNAADAIEEELEQAQEETANLTKKAEEETEKTEKTEEHENEN